MLAWPSPSVPSLAAGDDAPTGDAQLLLHNTATGELEPAGPSADADQPARMYVCGITPYDATHLGHANTYVAFDTLNRVWRDLGLEVSYTQNVTDVDDPLLERAAATGVSWEELAHGQIQLFRDDMTALRVIAPDRFIGAVESVDLVAEFVARLEPTGLVYRTDDEHPDWYLRSVAAPGFGHLSGLSREEMLASFAENGGDPERAAKHDPLDSLVWRSRREGEPSWQTRLGEGRPGWHVECTAIALQELGTNFDVQGGGSDLIFPHHEMCAASAMAATGEPFAQVFAHSGMVALDGAKMSKSKGNLELVSRLRREGVDPMAIRLALLDHHYRSDWEWTADVLAHAEARLARWRTALAAPLGPAAATVISQLRAALRRDLDTPEALRVVDAWVAQAGTTAATDPQAPAQVAVALDALLGLDIAPEVVSLAE